jgi:hypothetical protein
LKRWGLEFSSPPDTCALFSGIASFHVRIPSDAGQRSEMMAIAVPN